MMGAEIDRMGWCMNASGRIPDTATLVRLKNVCGDTLSRHERAMTEVLDLAHAHAEEAHYHEVMMHALDDAIDASRGMMMEMGSAAFCMEAGGMHGPMMP